MDFNITGEELVSEYSKEIGEMTQFKVMAKIRERQMAQRIMELEQEIYQLRDKLKTQEEENLKLKEETQI